MTSLEMGLQCLPVEVGVGRDHQQQGEHEGGDGGHEEVVAFSVGTAAYVQTQAVVQVAENDEEDGACNQSINQSTTKRRKVNLDLFHYVPHPPISLVTLCNPP